MGRVTNEERREVARNIRNADLTKYASYYEEVKGWDHVRATRFVLVSNLGSAIGIEKAIFSIDDLKIRLADLIEPGEQVEGTLEIINGDIPSILPEAEPTVDRDELLRIAEQMEKSSERRRIRGFARRIREACGK